MVFPVAELADQMCAHLSELLCRQALQELSDQRHLGAVFGVLVQKLFELEAQSCCDLTQQQNRDVAMPGFELSEIALGYLRFACEIFAGQAASCARRPHALAELHQKIAGL